MSLFALKEEVFSAWLSSFQRTYQHPDITPFYKKRKYAIFMHQAVLVGVILNRFSPDQLAMLPESYNYPLYMHTNYPPEGQPSSLNQLVTVRYEKTSQLPDFLQTIPVNPPLEDWFKEKKFLPFKDPSPR
jgi:hypothetical protein